MKVETRVISVAADGTGSGNEYRQVVACLGHGGLVAFPSETVYGLGGDACNPGAVAAIFAAKGRPADNPLIVHVKDLAQALEFGKDPDGRLAILAKAFWPGPLTVVLQAQPKCRETVSRGLDTVAIRVPAHPVALRLIRESGFALAAPSANLSGRPSPTRADHVWTDLSGRIPFILDGGPCEVGIESTVLDISAGETRILRPGKIDVVGLQRVLHEPVIRGEAVEGLVRSPGTRYRHYRPQARVLILEFSVLANDWREMVAALHERGLNWGYVGWRKRPGEAVPSVWLPAEPVAYAKGFYQALRVLDGQGVELILIDGPPIAGMGMALWDRLNKAADGQLADFESLVARLTPITSDS